MWCAYKVPTDDREGSTNRHVMDRLTVKGSRGWVPITVSEGWEYAKVFPRIDRTQKVWFYPHHLADQAARLMVAIQLKFMGRLERKLR